MAGEIALGHEAGRRTPGERARLAAPRAPAHLRVIDDDDEPPFPPSLPDRPTSPPATAHAAVPWDAVRSVTVARYGDTVASSQRRITGEAVERRIGPEDWPGAIEAVSGPQIVVGGPGTGKTEFLVRRAVHLAASGAAPTERVLALSFGRRGVADFARRLRDLMTVPAPPMPVATFHSLAASIVEAGATTRGWKRPPQILTGPEQAALVRELLTSEDATAWPVAFRPLLGTATFADEVTDFLLRAGEQLLTVEALAAMTEGADDWRAMPGFVARYRAALTRRGRIDYGQLLSEAVVLCESGVADPARFEYVLVDEYQDTTVAQTRLLAALVAPHGNLTATADPYQSIYGFRGAAVQNVARFPTDFARISGAPAARLVLTTSFRTPQAILAAAERVTSGELPGAAGPVIPAAGSGRVDVHVFDQHSEEAEWIAGEVVRLNLEEHVPFASMAVFVRSTRRFVAELSRALHRRRVPHDLPRARLAEQPAVRFVLDLVAAATSPDPLDATRALRRVLLGPWFRLPLGALRDLERVRLRDEAPWADIIRHHLPEAAALADLLSDPTWATARPAAEGAWTVWSALPQLAAVALDRERAQDRAAWASLSQVLAHWNERNPSATLVDYRRLLLDEEFEARPLLSYSIPDEDRLTLTTLHQAKGLQFDVVFIADAVEGVFPDVRFRDSLLGVRRLLPDVPRESAAYRQFRLQEERRLAYTAMTRAARRVVWTATSTGFEEGQGIPSRFLALVAGTATVTEAATTPPRRDHPVTHSEAEAMLRRIAADPEATRARRLAALDILARGPQWGLRSPWRFAGMRTTGLATGLVPAAMRMSPSQAEAYLHCPRRYALQRRLGLADTPGPHAALGATVHDVLEMAEQSALAAGRARSDLADARRALAARFDPAVFGGEPVATAWYRRALVVIESLYAKWPSRGRTVAVERGVRAVIDEEEWTGIIDRIEEHGGALTIVDYKTSGATASAAEAAESLQLGFYLLAAQADGGLRGHGEPSAAEFWYPYASRDQRSLAVRRFDPANLPGVVARLRLAAAGIRDEAWAPTTSGSCDRCPVRRVCPVRPEGKEGFLA